MGSEGGNMASEGDAGRGQTTCAVHLSSDVVDAGAEITLHCTAACIPACDLRGHTLVVRDPAGGDRGSVQFSEFDGQTNRTQDFRLKAPAEAGAFCWSAVCPEFVKEDIRYMEASAPISFTVEPHTTHVLTWKIPTAIAVGERFRMKVGITCSNECDQTQRDFEIHDHEGVPVATATLGGDRWPGTTGLYFAEVELEAPAGEGLYSWTVVAPEWESAVGGSDVGVGHAEGSVSFGVRVVPHPEYRVRVEAVDKASQAPLAGARVVMHPYQEVTDAGGVVEVRVAEGQYRLFVSQTNFFTFGVPVQVAADMTVRAELDLEPVPERN